MECYCCGDYHIGICKMNRADPEDDSWNDVNIFRNTNNKNTNQVPKPRRVADDAWGSSDDDSVQPRLKSQPNKAPQCPSVPPVTAQRPAAARPITRINWCNSDLPLNAEEINPKPAPRQIIRWTESDTEEHEPQLNLPLSSLNTQKMRSAGQQQQNVAQNITKYTGRSATGHIYTDTEDEDDDEEDKAPSTKKQQNFANNNQQSVGGHSSSFSSSGITKTFNNLTGIPNAQNLPRVVIEGLKEMAAKNKNAAPAPYNPLGGEFARLPTLGESHLNSLASIADSSVSSFTIASNPAVSLHVENPRENEKWDLNSNGRDQSVTPTIRTQSMANLSTKSSQTLTRDTGSTITSSTLHSPFPVRDYFGLFNELPMLHEIAKRHNLKCTTRDDESSIVLFHAPSHKLIVLTCCEMTSLGEAIRITQYQGQRIYRETTVQAQKWVVEPLLDALCGNFFA